MLPVVQHMMLMSTKQEINHFQEQSHHCHNLYHQLKMHYIFIWNEQITKAFNENSRLFTILLYQILLIIDGMNKKMDHLQ